ncbi:MAG: hypothetical protein K0R15_654 [Clostridiales bacterium]|jgi:hypothetical protein|nr:hypothetical protein [Clostridiales bacterium]
MTLLYCPECGSELTNEMIDVNMCYECGYIIYKTLEDDIHSADEEIKLSKIYQEIIEQYKIKEDIYSLKLRRALLVFFIFGAIGFLGATLNEYIGAISLLISALGAIAALIYISLGNDITNKQKEIYREIYRKVDEICVKYKVELETIYETLLSGLKFSINGKEKFRIKLWTANDKLYIVDTFDKCFSDFEMDVNAYSGQSRLDFINERIRNNNIKYHSIPLHDIKYFVKEGDINYETRISGGGGGGSSMKGAVIGGVIAGGTGSVIGSRQIISEIKSETETHDTRVTILKYFEKGSLQSLKYPIEFFDIFEELIPNKEYNIVVARESTISSSVNSNSSNNINYKLSQLIDLKYEGFITEEEYTTKKQQILSQI